MNKRSRPRFGWNPGEIELVPPARSSEKDEQPGCAGPAGPNGESPRGKPGRFKHWHCAKCGHEVLAVDRPSDIKWTDGHVCVFPEVGDEEK